MPAARPPPRRSRAACPCLGPLLVGRLLIALSFFVDGIYKLSPIGGAWTGYRDFFFTRFMELGFHGKGSYGGSSDMCAIFFALAEICGALWLMAGFRDVGAGMLCIYIVPMSLLQHPFLLERGIDMSHFIPFMQMIGLLGGLIVLGSYSNSVAADGAADSDNDDMRGVSGSNSPHVRGTSRAAEPASGFDDNETPEGLPIDHHGAELRRRM